MQAAVIGGSGYAGGELLRILEAHPALDVGPVVASASSGRLIGDLHPQLMSLADRPLLDLAAADLRDVDVVFVAVPHGQSAAIVRDLPPEVAVVDLGADFRVRDPAAWRRWHGGDHAGWWPYGLAELPAARATIVRSRRVANPGCYATAMLLALAPLLTHRVVEPADLVVVAASGTSGAGRGTSTGLLATEVMGDLSAYKVGGSHQHLAEVRQALGTVAGSEVSLSFTPVLAPMPRGILATCTARLLPGVDAASARAALVSSYRDEPFVTVLPEGRWPHTAATTGSNSCQLQVAVDQDAGRVVVVAALDNLGKGAAGQAVQNANLVLGLGETTGLAVNGVAP